jgi:hypothetical protein
MMAPARFEMYGWIQTYGPTSTEASLFFEGAEIGIAFWSVIFLVTQMHDRAPRSQREPCCASLIDGISYHIPICHPNLIGSLKYGNTPF